MAEKEPCLCTPTKVCLSESRKEFPKITGTFFGCSLLRSILYWSLYLGPLMHGNYHKKNTQSPSPNQNPDFPDQRLQAYRSPRIWKHKILMPEKSRANQHETPQEAHAPQCTFRVSGLGCVWVAFQFNQGSLDWDLLLPLICENAQLLKHNWMEKDGKVGLCNVLLLLYCRQGKPWIPNTVIVLVVSYSQHQEIEMSIRRDPRHKKETKKPSPPVTTSLTPTRQGF